MKFLLRKSDVVITYERHIHRCHYGFFAKRYAAPENFRRSSLSDDQSLTRPRLQEDQFPFITLRRVRN